MKNKLFVALSTFAKSGDKPLNILKNSGYDYYVNPLGRRLNSDEVVKMGLDATGIIAGLEPYTKDCLSNLPNLKCISRAGVGLDNIDQDFSKSIGIEIRNTPNVVIQPVIELVLALLFDLLRKTTIHTNLIKSGNWDKRVGNLLYGKTVGIIGTGRIGKKISEVFLTLGVKVNAYDIYPDKNWSVLNKIEYIPLNNLLEKSDIISLHAAPVGNKQPIIGKKEIKRMKPGVLIINTSRGQFIDEQALYNGLDNKIIGGIGLDVFNDEPYLGELTHFENAVFTPHVATLTKESRLQMEIEATNNLLDFFE